MDEPRPLLTLVVPADRDAVLEGLAELTRCLAEDYGASLYLRMASSPLPLYCGYWPADLCTSPVGICGPGSRRPSRT